MVTSADALAFLTAVEPRGSRPAAVAHALRHPMAAARSLAALQRLPSIDVRVSDTPAGAHIRALTNRRSLGVPRPRYAISVLAIADPDDYLRGRARTAVRNNCTRARDLGVTCRRLDDIESQLGATHRILTLRNELDNWPTLRALIELQRDRVFVAEADGEPVAIAFVTVDEEIAGLGWFLSVRNDPRGSAARYLLHVHIVEELNAQKVRHLFADAVVVISDGLRYFQDRLGFGVANLRFRR